jgi:hypothetical protein
MNEIQDRFKLTDDELNAVQHRLDAMSMEDVFDGQFSRDEVADINLLLSHGKLEWAEADNAEIVAEILIECIEGSTWHVSLRDGTFGGEALFTTAARVLRSAAEKIGAYYKRRVDVPQV